jgi:hypothetical protein
MKSVTALLILFVLLVAAATETRANGTRFTRKATATDVPFERTLTCFSRDSSSFLVNTGTEPLVLTGLIVVDPTGGDFDIKAPKVPDTLNPGELLLVPVTFSPSTPGSFTAKITYQVSSLDGSSRVGEYISNLSGEGYVDVAHVTIGRDYSVFPGTVLKTPIELEDNPDAAHIDRLAFRITFDSAVITPSIGAAERIYSMFAGTLIASWGMTVTALGGITFSAEFIAPPGEYLHGPGILLNLEFIAGFGNGLSSEIEVEITAIDRPCVTFKSEPGKVRLQSLTPFAMRLEPNMTASNQITMYLRAGEPATVTAQVFASDGELIQTLFDNQAYSAGSYSSNISTEGLAPGSYTLVVRNERQQFIERFIVLR